MGIELVVKMAASLPYPSSFHISLEKSSLKSRRAVSKIYVMTIVISPGRNNVTNSLRSSSDIGLLGLLSATSSVEGGGVWFNNHVNAIRGTTKKIPVTNGIHNSLTPLSVIRNLPTLLVKPEE